MAPICRTDSVVHNGTMAVILEGIAHFPPQESYDAATGRQAMLAVLISDLTVGWPCWDVFLEDGVGHVRCCCDIIIITIIIHNNTKWFGTYGSSMFHTVYMFHALDVSWSWVFVGQ